MYHNSITNSSFVPRHFSTPPRNMAPRRNPTLPAVPETPTHSFVVQEPRFEDDPQDVEEVSEPAQDSTATLAEAIALMTAELRHREPKKTNFKSNKPDTFDGSDPKKLNNFVLLCGLHFRCNPSSFDNDGAKVTFALSYLRGTALELFEPSVLDPPEDCDWLEDWSAFVRTLRKDFGPIDPAADAEDSLDNLKMWENQRILKYNVEFNHLSILTGWKGPILKHRYYTGLAEHIKDVIGQQGKPADLAELKSVAHAIDARHWERLCEKTRNDSKTPQKSDNKTNSNGNKSDNKSNNGSSSSKNKSNGSTSNNNNGNNNKSAKPSTSGTSGTSANSANSANPISDKLGKDGKLSADERQRRFDNELCLYCGIAGHKTKDCKKAAASKTKGRAAQVQDKDKDSSKKV